MKNEPEFAEFENAKGELPPLVQKELKKTEQNISAELQRSQRRFFISFFFFSVFGYFLSLSVCSQNSIALTRFSIDVAARLHKLPDPLCPIVCGSVFALIPVSALFFFLDRFQRRRLIVLYWWLPVLMSLLTCLLMSFLPSAFQHTGMHVHTDHTSLRNTHGDVVWLLWWSAAAVAVPLGVAGLARIKMMR